MTALSLQEAYEKTYKVALKVAWLFVRTHKADSQEVLSQTNYLFCKACSEYVESVGVGLSTWVHRNVFWGLVGYYRREKFAPVTVDSSELDRRVSACRVSVWEKIEEASRDARKVVALVLEPPPEILSDMGDRRTVSQKQGAVVRWLKGAGWTTARIVETFCEVRDLLR